MGVAEHETAAGIDQVGLFGILRPAARTDRRGHIQNANADDPLALYSVARIRGAPTAGLERRGGPEAAPAEVRR